MQKEHQYQTTATENIFAALILHSDAICVIMPNNKIYIYFIFCLIFEWRVVRAYKQQSYNELKKISHKKKRLVVIKLKRHWNYADHDCKLALPPLWFLTDSQTHRHRLSCCSKVWIHTHIYNRLLFISIANFNAFCNHINGMPKQSCNEMCRMLITIHRKNIIDPLNHGWW